MTAGVDAPDNLNFFGWGSYHANGAFSATMMVPDALIKTLRIDQAAAQTYNKHAPDSLKQAVSNTKETYTTWANNHPNSAQVVQFGTNTITTLTGTKAGLAGRMGRGNDDFANATTIQHTDDYFTKVGDWDLGNVYDRQKQHDLKPTTTSHERVHQNVWNDKDGKNNNSKIESGRSYFEAQSANAQVALSKKLSGLENAQNNAVKIRELPDGRIRYYDEERPARTLGKTRGNSFVTEYDPKTGNVRQWMESYDHGGNVTMVHPKSINGQTVTSQHYPPTKSETESWKKSQ